MADDEAEGDAEGDAEEDAPEVVPLDDDGPPAKKTKKIRESKPSDFKVLLLQLDGKDSIILGKMIGNVSKTLA